jgi:hypothetical protein
MKVIFLIVAMATLLAGTTYASAQVRHDRSGWALQHRGVLMDRARDPARFGTWGRYGLYGAYGSYAYAPGRGYYGSYLRDNPPGSSWQDRGINEENGQRTR